MNLETVGTADERTTERTDPLRGTRSIRGIKVLLVEDVYEARVLFRRALTEAGAFVFAAADGAEAWAAIAEFRPTVIVSDIGLPNENGITFIKRLRKHEAETGRRIPALAVTAFEDFYSQATGAGFDACLEKPATGKQLVAKLEDLVATVAAVSLVTR